MRTTIVDMAYEVIDMQQRILELEREVAHYKDLHEMNCKRNEVLDDGHRKMMSTIFNAVLDPNSVRYAQPWPR